MIKIINSILGILKIILLLVSFALTFYVIMFMYKRLDKSYFEALEIFAPYLILLFIFIFNYLFEQKHITSNIFYNVTCCLVFTMLIFVGYRAIFDNYMVMGNKMGYNIGFNYFGDIVAPLKSMLYLLIFSNLLLMFVKDNEDTKLKIDNNNKTTVKKEDKSK